MDIHWFGHACFRIREKGVTAVTDPHPEELGYARPRVRADMVTVSHAHEGHSSVKGFRGSPRVLDSPGEYEIGGVFVTGVPTFHDDEGGEELGQNVAFLFDFDSLTVCHLGDLGHTLTAEQVEELGDVDVLLLPVGGVSTINAAQAAEVVRQLEPKMVVPMHYQTPDLSRELEPVAKFLKEMGVSQVEPQPKLSLTKSNLPLSTQVYLLSY